MKRFLGTAILSLGLIIAGVSSADAAGLRGNPSSKVYHTEACQLYKSTASTAMFNAEADAKAKGYSPCKACVLAASKVKLPALSSEPYVGNAKTKVFHKAGCKAAPKKEPVGIQNLLQAHKNGFKPCKVCKPAGKAEMPK